MGSCLNFGCDRTVSISSKPSILGRWISVIRAEMFSVSISRRASSAVVADCTINPGSLRRAISSVAAQISTSSTIRTLRAMREFHAPSGQKTVADTVYRKEVARAVRIRLQLLAQPHYMSVYCTGIWKRLITPHGVEYHVAR